MQVDINVLKEFEKALDPAHPESSKIPARVLGCGEISTIFEIQAGTTKNLACKRMPIFKTKDEVAQYEALYKDYNEVLEKELGINIPEWGFAWFTSDAGNIIAFDIQRKLNPESIGNRAIHILNTDGVRTLFVLVLRELTKVWRFNLSNPDRAMGIDGQISNWSIVDFDAARPQISPGSRLLYIDTSTPLMKKEGVERLDPELFLRSAPSFLVWLIRWLFLEGVMTRYYDARLVATDLIANFYKEQRPELVPGLVQAANEFYASESASLGVKPLTEKEIKAYYKEDALIWVLFLAFRRFDRWLHKYILRKPYIYILPGKIKR
ncbi:MAG: hypothetical protein D4R38_00090 [Dehalococcoidia bacterium]|nr:MAG: hypothetical protein D4R38_00090 [Dehalococcoidia bacterium]